MLRSLKELKGYRLAARDDDVGKVIDFYFDDHHLLIRYFVVDLGLWLPSRKVLISPAATVTHGEPNWRTNTFPTDLTKEQIEKSPDIDVEKPVSREQEEKITAYFGWPTYWVWGQPVLMPPAPPVNPDVVDALPQSTLRSTNEVEKYDIQATDQQLGHVHDFIVDTSSWHLRYLVVDTRKWLPGRHVLIAKEWITAFEWSTNLAHVSLSSEEIKSSPDYNPNQPVNRVYEEKLYDYYGRPKYW